MTFFLLSASSILFALAQATTPPGPAAPAPSSPAAPAPSPSHAITPNDPKERMELAKKVNGLLEMDIPWHLKATYEVLGDDGKSIDTGTYEEWRVSAKQYRIALHSQSISVEEYGGDHGTFRTGKQSWPGKPLSAIQTMIERPIAPVAQPEKTELRNFERNFGSGNLPCTALSVPSTKKPEDAESYCFDPVHAALLYASTPNRVFQTLFREIVSIHDRYQAKDMQMFLQGRPWLKVHIDTIAALNSGDLQALTVPADAIPVTARTREGGEAMRGRLVEKAVPAYPSAAKLQGVQGTVVINGIIGTNGHFRELHVLSGPPMLQQAALDAARQWVYSPYLVDGQAVEVETDINVVFVLAR
jgi:TonB family protein